MGLMSPVYPPEELNALDEKQRRILQEAILHQLQTSPEIRNMLRMKTLPVYEKLTRGKRKASAGQKKK
jgi:hypothetical protein